MYSVSSQLLIPSGYSTKRRIKTQAETNQAVTVFHPRAGIPLKEGLRQGKNITCRHHAVPRAGIPLKEGLMYNPAQSEQLKMAQSKQLKRVKKAVNQINYYLK